MTATETEATNPPTTADTWTAELAQLRARYKSVREPILAALNLLRQNPNITDSEAKAQAATRGVRITAASISGARNLLAKAGDAPDATTMPAAPATASAPRPAPQRPARRVRPTEADLDPTALIQEVVAKLQTKVNAEADRLRDAIRRAAAVLQAAMVGQ
jgi:hypothetical protein